MRMLDNSVSQTFNNKHTSSDILAQLHIISSNYITVIVFQGFRTGYTYVQPLERIEPARLANDVSLKISPFIKTKITVAAQWESQQA